MITLLIGHRGSGKTSLLERLRQYGVTDTFDLDSEVAGRAGKSVGQIFDEEGEARFRQWEEDTLLELAKNNSNAWIAVGAGYSGKWPENTRKWWVRRPTDANGRIFLDRPRLNSKVSAFAEYMERFNERQKRYSTDCDSEITLLEGFNNPAAWEKSLLGLASCEAGGIVTILPERLKSPTYLDRLWQLNPWKVEVRNDLLNREQQNLVIEKFGIEKILFSYRSGAEGPSVELLRDWAMELGTPRFEPEILSTHRRQTSLSQTLSELPRQQGGWLKLAIPINNWEELKAGHEWWMGDPQRRTFLPMSADGRWAWYRLLTGPKSGLAFWREGAGSAEDQPYLAEWLNAKEVGAEHFAAILGDPVTHSFTPAEQAGFFKKQNMPVLRIPMKSGELNSSSLNFLASLGLNAAAVTSPVKVEAFQVVSEKTAIASSLESVNTLGFQNRKWIGHNTDLQGFQVLGSIAQGETAVWGGGGTQAVMRSVLPQAKFFSARTPELPTHWNPQTLVWAVGRNSMSTGAQWPPETWRPTLVLDLNYSEDSPAREYALRVGARFESGLAMFKAQAEGQREFWLKCRVPQEL